MADEDDVRPARAEPQEDPPPPDCPPCKAGAPAWMATFADMATLLMAFFVLILSFAHLNVPKYKQVSGSMRTAFGVQNVLPVIEPPKADNIVVTQYMSAEVEPTALRTIEEQRTDEPQPEDEELRRDRGDGEASTRATEETLEEALAQQIAEGKVRVQRRENLVQVELLQSLTQGATAAADSGAPAGQVAQDTLEIFAAVAAAQTSTTTPIQVLDSTLPDSGAGTPGDSTPPADGNSAAASRYEQIRASLSQEIAAGLAQVTREGDKVFIRLAEQGSFASGRAELQPGFAGLLDRVGSVLGEGGLVTIEGHTDNVALGFGSRYSSNWDLSAARSAAVADYLLARDFLQPGSVNILGLADTRPVADNSTPAGRAANRRIEIIVAD